MADCIHSDAECKSGEHFIEYERTFRVNSKWLPEKMGQPYVFIQAYLKGQRGDAKREVSIRYMPASNQGTRRIKDKVNDGARDKVRIKISGEEAHKLIYGNPVVVKFRYALNLHGRWWFVEYRPLEKIWIAETEFTSQENMDAYAEAQYLWPPFIGEDISDDPAGYTRNHAKMLSNKEIDKWIETAKDVGTTKEYKIIPPNDADIEWAMGKETEEEYDGTTLEEDMPYDQWKKEYLTVSSKMGVV